MKREYLLKMLLFWMVICLPVWAGAEDLGFLRLSQMAGDVQIQSKGLTEWLPATINLPVQNGDRLWVPKGAWAQVETRDGSVLRLDADSALEILAVDEQSLQVYLSQGQAYLNFKRVNDAMFQVDTPVSSIRIYDSSTLNVALAENGNTEISVFRGAVFAENRSGEVRVGAGKMLSMGDDLPSLMALAPPDDWERWNKEWDESLAAGEESEQYLPPELSGYGRDLNRNGRWVETREYGYVWTPIIDNSADWAPYRHGRWVWIGGDYVWIASEPWGWAPYHYGRWSYISSHGWCWVPPPRHEVYWGPGYVSWVSTANDVAWVPLAPGETYYGHGHYGPHSVNVVDVDIYPVVPGRNYRNVHVHNAVSVVRRDAFLRGQYRDMRHKENPFLRERINIGRPRLEPERATMMPIVRDIPREHQPPLNIRSLPGRTVDGERPMVRDRDRSVFRPTGAPRPLAPTIRMSPDPTVKQGREQTPPAPSERQQMLEHSVMPRQFGGRPTIDPEKLRSGKPPVPVQPQVVPAPAPARVRPVPEVKEEPPTMFRGQPKLPEQGRMPGQLRGRPTIDPEKLRSGKPPVPVQPQVVPAPAPARVRPVPEVKEEPPPTMFREQPQLPEQGRIPGQLRGRPSIDPEKLRSGKPPVPVRTQAAPPPAPAQPQPAQPDAEALKRFQEEQAAKKKEEKQDEGERMQEMLKQRGMRPRFP
ncbi:MAG: FecR family protein [Proteobacteria bacterium]|nr:FecR family protein [Pseudomonadota bacterium]MBU1649392.1 FecR family protein [Pseudomonadota bacterium]